MQRRAFIGYAAAGIGGLAVAPRLVSQTQQQRPPQIEPDLVKEFVIKGHGDFDRTKDLLTEHPGLLNVSWDWGGGDFEMAIEGAGHVGNREIAEYLLARGARMTLFVAAMLGRIDVVKPILLAYPGQAQAVGPHGLGLRHHAEKGGDQAMEVLEFLQELGSS